MSFDIFDLNGNEEGAKPLAERMRANNLNEFVGQKHIVSEGSLLRRAIATDRLGSCIFFGPPGTGKTTLANIIASTTHGEFIKLNAVQAGVADVKKAVEEARNNLKMYGKRTYLMLDECHRFNKTQSDSLLPAIEQGTIIFIGSTTENPYASMTPAIVSRCRVFEFRRLTEEEIKSALLRALGDKRKGLGEYKAEIEEGAEKKISVILCNKLYLPQYFTVRVLDVPAEWNVKNGSERCVGLEHWHGSKKAHTNGFDFIFTPAALTKHKYKLILELAPNGRGESYYIPLTLLNGACK